MVKIDARKQATVRDGGAGAVRDWGAGRPH